MKNESIMIYVMIAILYGVVGWLLYSMYEKKENYGNGGDSSIELSSIPLDTVYKGRDPKDPRAVVHELRIIPPQQILSPYSTI